MKRFLFLLTSLLLTMQTAVVAQSMTLDECRMAARRNYPVAARLDLIRQTQEATLENISKGWLPQITAMAQGTLQSDVTSLPDGMAQMLTAQGTTVCGISRGQYRLAVDVQQTVYDGGRISAANHLARRQADADRAVAEVELYSAEERAEQLFFGVLLFDERIRLNGERARLLADNLRKLEVMHNCGTAAACDVAAMCAEVLACRQDSLALRADREAVARMLALLCGFNAPPRTLIKPTIADFIVTATRPELYAIDARISLLEAEKKRLNTSLLPTFSLFAQGWYGYTGFDMFHDMMQRMPTLNGLIGARLTWNITPLYTRRTDLTNLRLRQERAENDRDLFLLNQRLAHTERQAGMEKYRNLLAEDDEIVNLRSQVRCAAEARLDGGVIDVNALVQELTRENQAKDTRALHEVQMLQEACALQHIGTE